LPCLITEFAGFAYMTAFFVIHSESSNLWRHLSSCWNGTLLSCQKLFTHN